MKKPPKLPVVELYRQMHEAIRAQAQAIRNIGTAVSMLGSRLLCDNGRHLWQPVARNGIDLCVVCGRARRAKRTRKSRGGK